jgi:DNA-binding transcriptional ArsR family regulator
MTPSINGNGTTLEFDNVLLRKAQLHYRAANHALRQQIMQLLHKNGEMIVTNVYVKLKIEQSVASQHLAILRKAGLVIFRNEGKNKFYSVNYDKYTLLHREAAKVVNGKK